MDAQRDGDRLDLEGVLITSLASTDVSRGLLSILEATALWAGEEPSLEPRCVSPVLAIFVGMWGEGLNGPVKRRRSELKAFVPRLARSASDEWEEQRLWMLGDWLVRDCAVAVLAASSHADLRDAAGRLRSLPSISEGLPATTALPVVEEVRALVADRHDELRPHAYLYAAGWSSAAGRIGALAAWNAVVDPIFCSRNAEARPWRPQVLVDLARGANTIVEHGVGLLAEPAVRAAWAARGATPPVRPRGSGAPGIAWANLVTVARRRYGQDAYCAGMESLAPFIDTRIDAAMSLLDRLLLPTDPGGL